MFRSLCQSHSEVRDISPSNAHTLTLQYMSFAGVDLICVSGATEGTESVLQSLLCLRMLSIL